MRDRREISRDTKFSYQNETIKESFCSFIAKIGLRNGSTKVTNQSSLQLCGVVLYLLPMCNQIAIVTSSDSIECQVPPLCQQSGDDHRVDSDFLQNSHEPDSEWILVKMCSPGVSIMEQSFVLTKSRNQNKR
jgi:hypothetical protein